MSRIIRDLPIKKIIPKNIFNCNYDFTLQEAFFPNKIKKKYFPSVGRVNESYGDINLKLK